MTDESEKKTDNLIDKEKIEEHEKNLEKEEPKKIEEKIEDQDDDFQGYTKAAKYQLFILFFFLGIINWDNSRYDRGASSCF